MRVLVFDTETTGLPTNSKIHPKNFKYWPHIVQISWLIYDDVTQKITNINDHIIKLADEMKIPEESTKIHGITNEIMNAKGKPITEILKVFRRDYQRCQMLIAHNFDFDKKVIQAAFYRNKSIDWMGRHRKIEYCTMKYGMKFTNLLRKSN